MIELHPLQSAFKAYLLGQMSDIAAYIESTPLLSHHERLNIYQNAYHARLQNVLAEDYDMLARLMGEDAFQVIAANYIHAYPSQNPSLRYFGQYFSEYLSAIGETISPHLVELAQLEWGFVHAFDAKESDVLELESLQTIPPDVWPEAHFEFHPSVILIPFAWNTVDIWAALKADEPIVVQKLPEPTTCVIWRHHLDVQYRLLSPSETKFFESALRNNAFSVLCEELLISHTPEEAIQQAAAFVTQWVQNGLITKINF